MKPKNSNSSQVFKIGLVTIITAGLFFFGINYLKGKNIFSRSHTYYVTLNDTNGLGRSSSVTLNGYRVGHVSDIQFDYSGMSKSIATLSLDRNLKLPIDTSAEVYVNPFGGAQLKLKVGNSQSMLQSGDTIQSLNTIGLLSRLESEIVPNISVMIANMDTLISKLNTIVSDPTIPETLTEINTSAQNIRQASHQLNNLMRHKLPTIVDNIDATTQSLHNVAGAIQASDIEGTIQDFKLVVTNLQKATAELDQTNGTLGRLLNDSTMYFQLQRTIESADSLMTDIKKNPKRYVKISIF